MTIPASIRGYPVKLRTIAVAGRNYEILGPDNFESLLDDPRVAVRFERDGYMPYWAEFWPAAVLLAEEVAKWGSANRAARQTVLEFGCGLGLVGLVAAGLGYDVTMSDYDDDALAFVQASAERNGIPVPTLRWIDWRETYPELALDRIVAAEVLYEKRNLEPIAGFLAKHLKADGIALICDRNRQTADAFAEVCAGSGLDCQVVTRSCPGIVAGEPIVEGRIFECRRIAG